MNDVRHTFRLGLVINPYAGVGGPTAHKGSDADAIAQAAFAGELPLTAPRRALTFLQTLLTEMRTDADVLIITVPGLMGASTCADLSVQWACADYSPSRGLTNGEDTKAAVAAIVSAGVDLLVFVGGDGTARDVCSVIGTSQVALGVPAGVKMHSGVYAVNPQMAAAVVSDLMSGNLVNVSEQEVRDIDEQAFREGVVKSRFFGDMLVPQEERFIQAVKQGGFELEDSVLLNISQHLKHHAEPRTLFIMGPGSTTLNIQKHWGLTGTLLGVDLVRDGQLLRADADALCISANIDQHDGPVLLVVTAIGGQGHIIGRGNQQIDVQLLKRLGRDNLRVVATRTKLKSFKQRPLMIDSGDPQLDRAWQGYIPVITGFDDVVFYPLGYFGNA